MTIRRFEDIEGWQMARELTRQVYAVAMKGMFRRDFGLRDQITRAAGSIMHNIAEGFDAGSNAEFAKYLRYSQRSCSEVQSQLYVALDCAYITQADFDKIYQQAAATHGKIGGFIRYLINTPQPISPAGHEQRAGHEQPRTKNEEPGTRTKHQEHKTYEQL